MAPFVLDGFRHFFIPLSSDCHGTSMHCIKTYTHHLCDIFSALSTISKLKHPQHVPCMEEFNLFHDSTEAAKYAYIILLRGKSLYYSYHALDGTNALC
jgi:hypothetical protein